MSKRLVLLLAGVSVFLIIAGLFMHTGQDSPQYATIPMEETPLSAPETIAGEYDAGYGITWRYNPSSDNSVFIGFSGDQQVARLTVLSGSGSEDALTAGMTREDAERILGSPVSSVNGTRISFTGASNKGFYPSGNDILILYYDSLDNNRILFIARISKTLAEETRFFTSPSVGSYTPEDAEAMTVSLLNALRSGKGKSILANDLPLSSVARQHSQSMVEGNYFSHDNSAGQGPKERIKAAGIKYRSYGEALTAGTWTPMDAVQAWMNSSAHRDIILGDYSSVGVGIASGNATYGIYYTLDIIRN